MYNCKYKTWGLANLSPTQTSLVLVTQSISLPQGRNAWQAHMMSALEAIATKKHFTRNINDHYVFFMRQTEKYLLWEHVSDLALDKCRVWTQFGKHFRKIKCWNSLCLRCNFSTLPFLGAGNVRRRRGSCRRLFIQQAKPLLERAQLFTPVRTLQELTKQIKNTILLS